MPSGHVTRWASQSIAKCAMSKPWFACACQLTSGRTGPTSRTPCSNCDPTSNSASTIPGVDQVVARQQALGRQRRVDRRRLVHVGGHGRGGLHVRDQMDLIRLTCLAHMDLVPGPRQAPLVAEGRLRVVRRVDPLARRRQIGRGPPADPAVVEVELRQPDPAQDLDGGDLPQPGRRRVAPEGVQEAIPVAADDLGVRVAGLLALGQARLLDPRRVAVEPLGRDPRGAAIPARPSPGR